MFVAAFVVVPSFRAFGQLGQEAWTSDETVDAQAFTPDSNGYIDDDPGFGPDSSWDVTGALADGTSVVVIYLAPAPLIAAGTDSIAIQLTSNPPLFAGNAIAPGMLWPSTDPNYVGSLFPYNGQANGYGFPTVPVPDICTDSARLNFTNASTMPLIIYWRPPNNFWYGQAVQQEPIAITVVDLATNTVIDTINLNLVREPVLVAHGVCSSKAAMTDWATLLQNNWQGGQNLPGITGYDVDYFDYSDNQDSGFPEIAGELEDCIGGSPTICSGQNIGSPRNSGKIYSYRMSGIAATRLDYCAHSMGGCVAKWYAENYGAFTHARINGFPAISWTGQFTCNRADNFGAGEFHRIITIGSPLNGSPLADSLVANAGYNGLQLAAGGAHLNGDLAAAEDLRQTSWVIRNCLQRGNPNAQFLPLVGTADNQPLAALTGSGFWQWVGAQLFTWPLAGGTADDWVVPVGSQIDAKGQAGGQGSKPVHNVVHTSEHGAWECGLWSAKALDRYFDWPAETFTLPSGRIEVYSAGCVMFNSNF